MVFLVPSCLWASPWLSRLVAVLGKTVILLRTCEGPPRTNTVQPDSRGLCHMQDTVRYCWSTQFPLVCYYRVCHNEHLIIYASSHPSPVCSVLPDRWNANLLKTYTSLFVLLSAPQRSVSGKWLSSSHLCKQEAQYLQRALGRTALSIAMIFYSEQRSAFLETATNGGHKD